MNRRSIGHLKASGEDENTIIIFLSDHGMPLPFAKTQLYHHSSRTPLMIRWPGVTKDGTVDEEHLISTVDLLPTILDMLGIASPEASAAFERAHALGVLERLRAQKPTRPAADAACSGWAWWPSPARRHRARLRLRRGRAH